MTEVLLLDGGMGLELARRGAHCPPGLWSAKPLVDSPALVVDTHRAFIDAGAAVITVNSYGLRPRFLEEHGLGDRFQSLLTLSGELAHEARAESRVLIAGSLPPLDWSYRPELIPPRTEREEHYAIFAEQLAPWVDVFLCETMTSGDEARSAIEVCLPYGKPVWVSFSLNDQPGTGIRSGESINAAVEQLSRLNLAALLFNCCSPEAISAAIQTSNLSELPFGGYANAFRDPPHDYALREELDPDNYGLIVEEWLTNGATLVGGCCGMGPEHIARLRKLIDNR